MTKTIKCTSVHHFIRTFTTFPGMLHMHNNNNTIVMHRRSIPVDPLDIGDAWCISFLHGSKISYLFDVFSRNTFFLPLFPLFLSHSGIFRARRKRIDVYVRLYRLHIHTHSDAIFVFVLFLLPFLLRFRIFSNWHLVPNIAKGVLIYYTQSGNGWNTILFIHLNACRNIICLWNSQG